MPYSRYTELLDTVQTPSDLRGLDPGQLPQLADEIRGEILRDVAGTDGHLGAGLGVVELTVALHHVFNTPEDRLIWDVGHQAHAHKILTGRRDRMSSMRQGGGYLGLPGARKVNSTHLAPATARRPSRLVWVWRCPGI